MVKGKENYKVKYFFIILCIAIVLYIVVYFILQLASGLFPIHSATVIIPDNSQHATQVTGSPSQPSEYIPIAFQELKTISANCLRSYSDPPLVITSQQEYQDRFSKFKTNGCQNIRLPEIDFNKHVLLLSEFSISGCEDYKSLKSDAYQYEKKKKIFYIVSYIRRCNLDIAIIKQTAVLLPKIPGYTVEFKVERKHIAYESPYYNTTSAAILPVILLLFNVGLLILIITSHWKVYKKAGKPGWTGIVPIYNVYVLLKIVGKPAWWLILYFIPIINVYVTCVVALKLAKLFGRSTLFGIVALWLFPIIGYAILAFDKSKYQGTNFGESQTPTPLEK
jgi:Family of unknown function (DUF5684)